MTTMHRRKNRRATIDARLSRLDRLFMVACAVAALATATPRATAHSNGHESRTVADCERLPGTESQGERAQCLRCVSRPRKHHYHPDYPPGERCRPDNGRP
jgi:hypothetical protein